MPRATRGSRFSGSTVGNHIAFNLLDDVKADGDALIVKLDADLLGDLASSTPDADDLTITLALKSGNGEAAVMDALGKEIGKCTVVVADEPLGRRAELQIPLNLLGRAAGKQRAVGLNIEVVDKDKDANATLLSWTGNYAPRHSPFGLGQLVLLQQAK